MARNARFSGGVALGLAVLLAGVALVTLAACGEVAGSGNVTSQARSVGSFTELSVSGDWLVDISIGEPQAVTLTGDDNILEVIVTEVRGDRLHIERKAGITRIDPTTRLKAEITVPALTGIDTSGSVWVTATGPIRADDFQTHQSGSSKIVLSHLQAGSLQIDLSGSGSVEATGSAESVELRGSGSASFRLGGLEARRVDVDLSGSGGAELNVSESLTGNLSGSTQLRVTGSPAQLDVETSGAAKVTQQ